ncbi:MAG: DUF2279 domain-containing protein [Bacteroidetes bacterium]|nr:DUF2279 domain-containing protein [Bacteroidota bacterium]
MEVRPGSIGAKAALMALLLAAACSCRAQERTDSLRAGRALLVAGGAAMFTTGSLIALNKTWYQGHARSAFHGFNDGDEWLQMDKLGHANSAYQLGRAGHAAFQWAGFDDGLSTWLGGSLGLIYLSGIEYLDGYSSAWGFSGWDMAANAAGTALFIGQERGWHGQRMMLKWSAHLTDYAPMRPDVLGATVPERLLKDYNGTTIWLSINPRAFGWKALPPWLNMAVGAGAEGMVNARSNPGSYRQVYLSPDIAFSRIPVRSKVLRTFFFMLDALKMPAPALEFRGNGGVKGHWLFF